MALARGRRRPEAMNYWPGFVDALSTLLLVFIFLLSVFVMAQYFLARDVGGKDAALARLNKEIEELTSLLSLEKGGKAETQQSLATLSVTLEQTRRERDALRQEKDAAAGAAAADLDAEKQLSAKALSRVDLLNQQIAALRSQLAAIQEALSAQETKDKENQARIADLGSRLNVALAQKVQELARYRSDFFGRLREILGDRPDVKVVGDRFVLPSEVLFESRPGHSHAGGPVRNRQDFRGAGRSVEGDPAGTPLGVAHRRPYRQAADLCAAIPLELGSFRRAKRSPSCNIWSARASRRSICWPAPSASSSRSTMAPAKTPCAATAASS